MVGVGRGGAGTAAHPVPPGACCRACCCPCCWPARSLAFCRTPPPAPFCLPAHPPAHLQLTDLLRFYLAFPIHDHTGDPLTQEDVTAAHYERVQQLQRLFFKHVPKLKELALANCGTGGCRHRRHGGPHGGEQGGAGQGIAGSAGQPAVPPGDLPFLTLPAWPGRWLTVSLPPPLLPWVPARLQWRSGRCCARSCRRWTRGSCAAWSPASCASWLRTTLGPPPRSAATPRPPPSSPKSCWRATSGAARRRTRSARCRCIPPRRCCLTRTRCPRRSTRVSKAKRASEACASAVAAAALRCWWDLVYAVAVEW